MRLGGLLCVGGLVGFGCSVKDVPERAASSASALTGPGVVGKGDGAGAAGVNVRWRHANLGTIGSSNALSALVTNTNDTAVTVRVLASSVGLDERTATATIATLPLAAHQSQHVAVPVAQFPVQSVGTQSQLTLQADLIDSTSAAPSTSTPLYYEFSANFDSATLYGALGKDRIVNRSHEDDDDDGFDRDDDDDNDRGGRWRLGRRV